MYLLLGILEDSGYMARAAYVMDQLMKALGLHEAILLGELCSEFVYWNKENKLQNGFFYSTRENIEKETTLSPHQQRQAITNLIKYRICKNY